MIAHKTKLHGAVFAEIRKYIRPTEKPEQFIDDTLLPYVDALDTILNFSYQGGQDSEPFSLTTQVLGYTTWTPEIVDQRQQDLMKKLRNLWRL